MYWRAMRHIFGDASHHVLTHPPGIENISTCRDVGVYSLTRRPEFRFREANRKTFARSELYWF